MITPRRVTKTAAAVNADTVTLADVGQMSPLETPAAVAPRIVAD